MKGKSMETAWNDALIAMARASRAHAMYLMLNCFVEKITLEFDEKVIPNEKNVMMDLALLFGLFWMEKDMSDFVEDNYMNEKEADIIRSSVLKMLDQVRPNAVALADAWDFSDFRLRSTLGRYDGNVYQAIIESSKKDSLNATEPGPGYEQHLKRLIVNGVGVYTGTASRL
uniref:Acyl-CoA oxidase C-terminal domain-containing protein n=1 Tax=Eucampia antarctica TaxID=49252 RepID=A0A7S2R0K5_9STRA